MSTSPLRARFLLAMGLPVVAVGCVGEAQAQSAARSYRPYVRGREVCVPASATTGDSQVTAPYEACRADIFAAAHSAHVALPCGPCAFSFNPARTATERRRHPDVCCYTGTSPSGPGRPLRARDASLVAPVAARDDWATA